MRLLLDGNKTDGELTVVRTAATGGSASPVHVHTNEDEIFVLLGGSGIFWTGEHRYESPRAGSPTCPATSRPKPDGWEVTPDGMAAAAAATGQNILGPALTADQMIPGIYLTGQTW
jgi:hypothetical protein